MSYEIYYKRAYIKVGNKFMPMIQHGSNNCWECSFKGRDIPEKNWTCLNYPTHQFLFTKQEIIELAKKNSKFETFKSRHTPFADGEFEKWIINGMKSARTVEEYTEYNNRLYLIDYTNYEYGKKSAERVYVDSTDRLLKLLAERGEMRIDFSFWERNLRLPKKQKKIREKTRKDHYFALKNGSRFLYKLRKNGYSYITYSGGEKKFETEKQALKYLTTYKQRLKDFEVVLVEKGCWI